MSTGRGMPMSTTHGSAPPLVRRWAYGTDSTDQKLVLETPEGYGPPPTLDIPTSRILLGRFPAWDRFVLEGELPPPEETA